MVEAYENQPTQIPTLKLKYTRG